MRAVQALRIIGDHAADQWGMVTTAQAVAAGVDRTTLVRLVDAGLLESPARGVYVVPAASPTHVDERAAWLRLTPRRADVQHGDAGHWTTMVEYCPTVPPPRSTAWGICAPTEWTSPCRADGPRVIPMFASVAAL